jgi:hypothetical protein
MINGLVPSNGLRSYSIEDKSVGIFMSYGLDQVIKMYASLFNYYNKILGVDGSKTLESCYRDIKFIYEHCNGDSELLKEPNETIYRVNYIRALPCFEAYLQGQTCILALDGVTPVSQRDLDDCFYDKTIHPSQISLVNIKDKYNNYYCTMEYVLRYLMSKYPAQKYSYDKQKEIINLYNYYLYHYPIIMNPSDYTLEEIPITYYDNRYQKTRSLTNYR